LCISDRRQVHSRCWSDIWLNIHCAGCSPAWLKIMASECCSLLGHWRSYLPRRVANQLHVPTQPRKLFSQGENAKLNRFDACGTLRSPRVTRATLLRMQAACSRLLVISFPEIVRCKVRRCEKLHKICCRPLPIPLQVTGRTFIHHGAQRKAQKWHYNI
jgi:hypothetical protein